MSQKETVVALTLDQVDRFTEDFRRFAEGKLSNGGVESIQELVDLWRFDHPTPSEEDETLAAIREGFEDVEAGRTVSAKEAFAAARKALAGLK